MAKEPRLFPLRPHPDFVTNSRGGINTIFTEILTYQFAILQILIENAFDNN